jgi:SnoaL-like polyketide cyclase
MCWVTGPEGVSGQNRRSDPGLSLGCHSASSGTIFTDDGIFTDQSVGITYRGPGEWAYPVRNYGTAFGDMHRELYDLWTVDDTVIVRLALQGTHTGPLETPFGTIPATGKTMDAPCR